MIKKIVTALKGFRTLVFNGAMGVVLVLNQFGAFGTDPVPTADDVNAGLDHFSTGLDSIEKGVAAALVFGNLILRAITNTTIGKKTSPAPTPPST